MTYAIAVAIGAALAAQTSLHRTAGPVGADGVRRMEGAAAAAYDLGPAAPPEGGARYHTGASLVCSDCHVMHASQEHAMDGSGADGRWAFPWVAAPNVRLLRAASATDLCLECHDGRTFAPDVLGADTNGLAERAAGYFDAVGVRSFRGHALGRDLSSDPSDLCNRCHFGGTMATAEVQCIDCHGPHGNGFYRNLQWASAPGHPAQPEIRAYTLPGATGMQRYDAGNVRYPAPALAASAWREVTNVCIDCHHTFMDDSLGQYTKPGGMAHFGRHPGTNSEWGAFRPIDATGANTAPDNWVSGTVGFDVPRLRFAVRGATSFAEAGVVAANNEVFCLTCHKAHGSEHPFALRWEYGDASSGRFASGCLQCHRDAQGQ